MTQRCWRCGGTGRGRGQYAGRPCKRCKGRGHNNNPVSEPVARRRNARWRHFGAVGQTRWAIISISYITRLETATDHSKQLAEEATQVLTKLLNSLSDRKELNL